MSLLRIFFFVTKKAPKMFHEKYKYIQLHNKICYVYV